jgi:hypothetical protein
MVITVSMAQINAVFPNFLIDGLNKLVWCQTVIHVRTNVTIEFPPLIKIYNTGQNVW